jgi:hypothetical protein
MVEVNAPVAASTAVQNHQWTIWHLLIKYASGNPMTGNPVTTGIPKTKKDVDGGILPIRVYPGILLDINWSFTVKDTPQKRALKNYRNRLSERGMARYEVLGLNADRDLIRSLAKRLAENDRDAMQIRATVSRSIAGGPPKKGGIFAALRRSPLVGADLDVTRARTPGREVDL